MILDGTIPHRAESVAVVTRVPMDREDRLRIHSDAIAVAVVAAEDDSHHALTRAVRKGPPRALRGGHRERRYFCAATIVLTDAVTPSAISTSTM
jgi:hypothetical protein